MVDWNLAVATAQRLTRPGPEVSRDEARAIVAELRRHAQESEAHVPGFTRMHGDGDAAPHGTPVLIVDRAGWVKANVAGFREVLKPLLVKMAARRPGGAGGAVLGTVGGKVTGVEVGDAAELPVLPGARAVRDLRAAQPRHAGRAGQAGARRVAGRPAAAGGA